MGKLLPDLANPPAARYPHPPAVQVKLPPQAPLFADAAPGTHAPRQPTSRSHFRRAEDLRFRVAARITGGRWGLFDATRRSREAPEVGLCRLPTERRCAGWGSGDLSRPPVLSVAFVPKAVRSGFAQEPKQGAVLGVEKATLGAEAASPAWESESGVPDPSCATLDKSALTGAQFSPVKLEMLDTPLPCAFDSSSKGVAGGRGSQTALLAGTFGR